MGAQSAARAVAAHGLRFPEDFGAMWRAQGGRCYLCEEPLVYALTVADHDHSCCGAGWSCRVCRRGLACHRCNRIIGQLRDDPELLLRIAVNLENALVVTQARIAAKPARQSLTG